MSGSSPEHPECFLCRPDHELVYTAEAGGTALCGLGPIVEGYSVLGAVNHVRSAADLGAIERGELVDFVGSIRRFLSEHLGPCLITEHGRVPVCQSVSGLSQPHCYHAHFLAFPNAPDVTEIATAFFSRSIEATTLHEALDLARSEEDYFLVSPDPNRFLVFSKPPRTVRQLSRLLVATMMARPALADWETYPMRDVASASAHNLRSALRGARKHLDPQ